MPLHHARKLRRMQAGVVSAESILVADSARKALADRQPSPCTQLTECDRLALDAAMGDWGAFLSMVPVYVHAPVGCNDEAYAEVRRMMLPRRHGVSP